MDLGEEIRWRRPSPHKESTQVEHKQLERYYGLMQGLLIRHGKKVMKHETLRETKIFRRYQR